MKITILILSLLFTVGIANAGDPIPGVDVSLEQIPGGVYKTESDCMKRGGRIVNKGGNVFCKKKRIVVNTETGNDGSNKFRHKAAHEPIMGSIRNPK